MASSRLSSLHSEIRTEFRTKEGVYKSIRASEHCRPSRQPLFGKELSTVRVSFVSCKDKEGMREWVVFNSGKELYFYPFNGVGKVPDLKKPIDKRVYKTPTIPVCHDFNLFTRTTNRLDLIVGFSTGPLQHLHPLDKQAMCAFNEDGSIDNTRVTCVKWVPSSETTFVSSHRSGNLYVWSTEHTGKTTGPQNYVQHAEIQDAVIHTVRSKNKSCVLFRWSVGHGPINSFAFSPDLTHIAIASQDGFLRLYDFPKQQFYGRMRSYYGGLLCVCWSPDGRYAVTGGEDDLITVWSFEHRKVVARGEGHKSYVNDVAFDPYTTYIPDKGFSASTRHSICSGGEEVSEAQVSAGSSPTFEHSSSASSPYLGRATSESGVERTLVAYRLGSIGQDTQLCLWDLSGDSLKLRRPFSRGRSRSSRQVSRPQSIADLTGSLSQGDKVRKDKEEEQVDSQNQSLTRESGSHSPESEDVSKANHVRQPSGSKGADPDERTELSHVQSSPNEAASAKDTVTDLEKEDVKEDKKEVSPSTSSAQSSTQSSEKGSEKKDKKLKKPKTGKKTVKIQPQRTLKDPVKRVMRFVGNIGGGGHAYRREAGSGSGTCFDPCNSDDIAPKMEEVNLIEPLVAKVISHERLTALVFRRDCIVTACQEGFVQTWARPDTELPQEAAADYSAQTNLPASSTISNPGLNSPRPGSGSEAPPLKTTTV